MARIRLAYLKSTPEGEPPAGSEAWCAARLGGLAEVAAKYKSLTGKSDFDALLAREKPPYVRYREDGDLKPLVAALRANAEALRINFPGYTSEVRYTDRVLRFPSLFTPSGIVKKAIPGIRSPNPGLLYSSVTGDPGSPGYFPLNAVRWLTSCRDIAALVSDRNEDGLQAKLFHFGRTDRPMGAEFYLLGRGRYTLTIAAEGQDPAQVIQKQIVDVTGRRCRVSFTLPPRRPCALTMERQH
jgi:hypothetical protein